MNGRISWVLAALLLGAILPIQGGVNTRLAKALESPVGAAFVSFAVGTLALLTYGWIRGQISFQPLVGKSWPWWMWTGGLLGTFFVAGITVLLPRAGGLFTFSMVIAGQLLAALVLDQFGLLGLPTHPITWTRVAGVCLLIVSIFLIRRP